MHQNDLLVSSAHDCEYPHWMALFSSQYLTPLKAKARRERADEIVYLIKEALKDGGLPPPSAR
jgi:hypothetical protein